MKGTWRGADRSVPLLRAFASLRLCVKKSVSEKVKTSLFGPPPEVLASFPFPGVCSVDRSILRFLGFRCARRKYLCRGNLRLRRPISRVPKHKSCYVGNTFCRAILYGEVCLPLQCGTRQLHKTYERCEPLPPIPTRVSV